MEKSSWKVKYVFEDDYNAYLTVLLRNGHIKGVLYKPQRKRITKKTCVTIIDYLEDEVGTQLVGSCVVDGDRVRECKVIKEYEI